MFGVGQLLLIQAPGNGWNVKQFLRLVVMNKHVNHGKIEMFVSIFVFDKEADAGNGQSNETGVKETRFRDIKFAALTRQVKTRL